MAKSVKTKKGLLKFYNQCCPEVKTYFSYLPKLINDFPFDVCLAYCFARLELGQNMALYCGVVKMHRADVKVARGVVSTHNMSRKAFLELYETVFDFKIPHSAGQALKTAEDTRDVVTHGKPASKDRLRNAIARSLEYAEAINKQLEAKCGLRPFGPLKGFAGRAKKLDGRTTRFMLKGMGFNLS